MSAEHAQAFRQIVSADPSLQARIRESIANGWDGAIALGSENGYEFSEADLEQVYGGSQRSELTDFEMELVVGGVGNKICPPPD